ncbi:MAG: hypothetical protein HYW25_02685 [Candidatus Aenigmarchaeota archaeon]|nr:hypothetical protein [Candidatus Aenigmarchaeota archaeon]
MTDEDDEFEFVSAYLEDPEEPPCWMKEVPDLEMEGRKDEVVLYALHPDEERRMSAGSDGGGERVIATSLDDALYHLPSAQRLFISPNFPAAGRLSRYARKEGTRYEFL